MTGTDLQLLPRLSPEAARWVLTPPLLPERMLEQVRAVPAAAGFGLPIQIVARTAGHRLRLARALHATARPSGPLLAAVGGTPHSDELPAGSSLYLEASDLGMGDWVWADAAMDDGVPWLLIGVEPGCPVPARAMRRLSVVTVIVPPLEHRISELSALAAAILGRLAARRGMPAPMLSPGALAYLGSRQWEDDVLELDMVLARALLHAGSASTLEVEHVQWAAVASCAPRPAGNGGSEPRAASGPGELDALALIGVVHELAHEIKNPLVTLKTFTTHLPEMSGDATVRDRFAALAASAVERMNETIENLLAFSRLARPAQQGRPLALAPLLERVLGEVEGVLADSQVTVLPPAGDGRCLGDPEALGYALRNVILGVVREAGPRSELALEAPADGVVRLVFAGSNGLAARLRRIVQPQAQTPDEATLSSLPFVLARATLTRAGGRLDVESDRGGRTAIVVSLPKPDGAGASP